MRSTTARAGTELHFAYVSKMPPSPSGVALYASSFVQVLRTLGAVKLIAVPAVPAHSQRLRSAVRGFLAGATCARRIVHVELSGRALFEFYFALGSSLRRSTRLVLTCHDVPSLVGPAMLFSCLDRRGLRRIGVALSGTIGRVLERRLTRRAVLVLALTHAGARHLSRSFRRPVHRIPHIAPRLEVTGKERIVFLPGYIGDARPVASVMNALAGSHVPWEMRVGATDPDTEAELLPLRQGSQNNARMSLLGFIDESSLLDEYKRAAIVVRVAPHAGGGNDLAASGPLVTAIAAGCIVGTNDHRAAAVELQQQGFVDISDDLGEWVREHLATDYQNVAIHRGSRVQAEYGHESVTREFHELLLHAINPSAPERGI